MRNSKSSRSSSVSTEDDEVFPLKPKQIRRFYEPIVLFKALTEISAQRGKLERPHASPQPQTEKEQFQKFVDKIANLCDSEKGGKTVTACVVIDGEDTTQYAFACNRIKQKGARHIKDFLAELLKKIKGVSKLTPAQREAIRSEVFKLIVTFNRSRIECYVSALQNELSTCIGSCDYMKHDEAPSIKSNLSEFQNQIGGIDLEKGDAEDYIESFTHCFREIKAFQKASINNRFIDQRAEEGRLADRPTMTCWSELRHHLTRLLAYERAVVTLFEAEKQWPELFNEIEIIWIKSSRPGADPLGKKSEEARNIIGRMSSDSAMIEKHRKYAERLQRDGISLDDRIQELCSEPFKPTVHCEILVLEWIMAQEKAPFFEEHRYIGTSKGACRLCSYYFEAHPTEIEARPSHGNLYKNWAIPPVLRRSGEAANQQRQKILNHITEKLRNDTLRILEDKAIGGKRHDSNTYNLDADGDGDGDNDDDMRVEVGGSDTSDVEGADEVTELTEQFDSSFSFSNASTEETFVLSGPEDSDDDDNDNEDGGATL